MGGVLLEEEGVVEEDLGGRRRVSEGVLGGDGGAAVEGAWGGAYEYVDVFAEGALGVRFDDAFDCGAGVEFWCCCHDGLVGV